MCNFQKRMSIKTEAVDMPVWLDPTCPAALSGISLDEPRQEIKGFMASTT